MTNNAPSVAILNTKAPFATMDAKESMDLALIMGSYEQNTHLYFQGDGVLQLIDQQSPETINLKNFLKTFSAFTFYDLDKVFVCKKSLEERQLTNTFHLDGVEILEQAEFSLALHRHSHIFRF